MAEFKRNYFYDLSAERLREVLTYNPETGVFIRKWTDSKKIEPGGVAGTINNCGYRVISVDHRIHLAHRLAWIYMTGLYPQSDIDHINGHRADNRFCNLREASPSQNLFNRGKQKNNSSGYKNVSWCRVTTKWVVRMMIDRRYAVIGYFDDVEEANKKAVVARLKHQKEFATPP
ncbi:HNH endonuclease [Fimbriiglobus ruber]|nr:HNH endonuclease [Fimbriiglobus ruber]